MTELVSWQRWAGRLLALCLMSSLASGCLRVDEAGPHPLFEGLQSLLIDRGTDYSSVSLTAPNQCGAFYTEGETTILGYKQDLGSLGLRLGVGALKAADPMWGSRLIAPPDRILNVDGDRVDDVSLVVTMPVEVSFPVLQAGLVVTAGEAIPPGSSLISVASTSGGALIKGGGGAPGKLYTVIPRLAGTTEEEDPTAELFLSSRGEAFHVIDGPSGLVWLKSSSDGLSLTIEGEQQLLSLPGSVTSAAIAHGRIALLEDLRTLLVLIFVETTLHYMLVDLKGGQPDGDWKSSGVTIAADTGLAVVGFRAEQFLIVPRYGEVHSISDRGEFDPPTKPSGVLRAVSLGPQRSAIIRELTRDKIEVEFSDDRPERVEFSDDRPKRQLDLTSDDITGAYNYLGSLMIRTGDGLVMCSPKKCGYIACVDGGGRSEVCGSDSVKLQRRDMVPPPSGHSPAQDFAIGPFLVSIPSRVSPAGSRLPPVIGPRSFVDLDGHCYN